MPKLIVIDPCLFNMSGHEYTMNKFIVEEGQKHGYNHLVLCHNGYKPNSQDTMHTVSVFRRSPYDKTEMSWEYDMAAINNGNQEIFTVLSKYLLSSFLPEGSMILLHTACNTLLVGLARWIKKIRRPDLKIRIVLRWPATRRVFDREKAELFCKKACLIYPRLSGDIRFYADNRGLVEYYKNLTGLQFAQTPIGIQFHDAPQPAPPDLERHSLEFVFAGTPRKEKGIIHISNAISDHIDRYPQDIFHIHTIKAYNLAKKFRDTYPNHVHTHNEFLSGTPYFEFLLRGDVVLIPYDVQSYELRTSHIFMEALGLGRAVIVSKDSWMEEVLQEFDAPLGVVMPSWDSEGLLHAMAELHERRSEILGNAFDHAEQIRRLHNPVQWMNMMFTPQS
jgi:hypothetical protein